MKKLSILLITTILSASFQSIAAQDNEQPAIDTYQQGDSLVSDSDIIQYEEYVGDEELQEIVDEDSVEFILPEGMTQNIDSILTEWYAKNCLYQTDCETSDLNPVFPDSVYAKRLSQLQTVINMPYNYIVRQFIDRYTGKNRYLVSYMLGAANYYMPIFEDALDYYGLPQELRFLPVIESALNPTAVSRARAKGLWQFIFQTGKLYGLKQNSLIDERFDPVKSSYAAARYLRDLYAFFGDWDLAISAYNCGPGNVRKAINRSGGKQDFWEIYRYLPRETRSYLPIFIAANYVMTYYNEHDICPMQAKLTLTTDTFVINKNLHFKQIAQVCQTTTDEIKALNPQYIKDIIPGESQSCTLVLPSNLMSSFIAAGDSIYELNKEQYFPKSKGSEIKREMSGSNSRGDGLRHKIKSGESLSTIARKYRVTVAQIKRWNGLKNNNIRAGKYLYIY